MSCRSFFSMSAFLMALLTWSPAARAEAPSPSPACTPPRGSEPVDAPSPDPEPAQTGVVRVDAGLKKIVVDGWTCPLSDGSIAVTCGQHVIKSKLRRGSREEELQTVNVPCGAAVVLGRQAEDGVMIAGGVLITFVAGLTFALAATAAGMMLCDGGLVCNRSHGTAALVVAIGALGAVVGGIAMIAHGGRTVPTATTVPAQVGRLPTGLASARIAIGGGSVALGFSF